MKKCCTASPPCPEWNPCMFDIRKLGLGTSGTGRAAGGKKKKKTGKSGKITRSSDDQGDPGFLEALESIAEGEAPENPADFISRIEAQGELLKQNPGRQEFLKYRQLIRKFLKKVVDGSFSITKQKVYKKDREYITVKVIDEKLFELGKYLLLEEAETIELAARIDEIKGLVYDSARDASGKENR